MLTSCYSAVFAVRPSSPFASSCRIDPVTTQETQNLPRSVSDNTIVILNVASFFGRIVPNFLGDTFGVFTLLTSCGAGISVLIFALYGATNSAGLIIVSERKGRGAVK